MANVYQKISQLENLTTKLNPNDLFIVSRPSGSDAQSYNSYKCTYDKLSSDVKVKIQTVIKQQYADIDRLGTVNTLADVKKNGTRLVQENVIAELQTNEGEAESNDEYLSKTQYADQTVVGDVRFYGTVTITTDPSSGSDAVNKDYVDTLVNSVPEPTIFSAKGFVCLSSFLVMSLETGDDPANGQIYVKKSNPIVFYNEDDCMLQIQFVGTAQTNAPIGIFAYDTNSTSYDTVRAGLISQFKSGNMNNLTLLETLYGYGNKKSVLMTNINVQGGTWIVVANGIVPSTEKTTVKYYGVWKNKNKSNISLYKSDPEYYTDSSGYSYHYKATTKANGRVQYSKEYDLKNKKKYKLYTSDLEKQVNKCVIDTKSATFQNGDVINFIGYN